jgi:hypothetical protein
MRHWPPIKLWTEKRVSPWKQSIENVASERLASQPITPTNAKDNEKTANPLINKE